MLVVPVKGNIERSLKSLKRKFSETGVVKELREREQFTKKSKKRREEIKKAIYKQRLSDISGI
jgi:small subunit ribosomal protein S21